jgi:hypothetical protein
MTSEMLRIVGVLFLKYFTMNGGRTIVYLSIKASTPVMLLTACDLVDPSNSSNMDARFVPPFFQLSGHKNRVT